MPLELLQKDTGIIGRICILLIRETEACLFLS